MVQLVLNLGLGPGLLLGLGTLRLGSLGALGGRRSFVFCRLLCFSLNSQNSHAVSKLQHLERGDVGGARRLPTLLSTTTQTLLTIFVVCRSDDCLLTI